MRVLTPEERGLTPEQAERERSAAVASREALVAQNNQQREAGGKSNLDNGQPITNPESYAREMPVITQGEKTANEAKRKSGIKSVLQRITKIFSNR